MFPDAVTFEAVSWLVWFCTVARIWGSESPSAQEKAWERSCSGEYEGWRRGCRGRKNQGICRRGRRILGGSRRWIQHCGGNVFSWPPPEADSLRQAKEVVKQLTSEETVTLICWEENCLGDELPHYGMQENASCTYATLRYATIHKHVEFRHMWICVDTTDLQGNAGTLCC